MRRRPGDMDYQLLSLTLLLLSFGMVMLYSASGIFADQRFHDSFYFLKKQMLWAVLGVPAMMLMSRFDYNRLREWCWPALTFAVLSLIAVLFGPKVGGARRWIRLGPVGFQPAELAKIAVVLFLADYLDRKRSKVDSPAQGLVVPWAIIGGVLVLIGLEPDLGTPALIFAVATMLLFIGGARVQYVLTALGLAVPVLAFELIHYPYRRQRLLHFLQPWRDPQGSGYQLVQSLIAVGSGGWFGRGLGASQLKLMYLPALHTDFIFPIIAEELGLLGSLTLLALFAALLIRMVKIARSAPNLFGMLLGAGIGFMIALQTFFNIAMSIGLVPTKGVPLPFFSFGGSSLLMTLISIGILLNISKQCKIRH